MRFLPVFLLSLISLLLIGCSGGSLESKVPGKYKLVIDTSGMSADQQKMADMAKGMLSNARVEIKADKTFHVTGLAGNEQKGTWRIDGDKIVMKDSSGNEDSMIVSSDGKKLSPEPNSQMAKSMQGAKMTLEKE